MNSGSRLKGEMLSVKADADEAAIRGAGGDECGARSAEWIEDDGVRLAECANERFQSLDRFLHRVKPVSQIGKIHDIRERIDGRDDIALGEEIGIQLFLPNSWEISAEGFWLFCSVSRAASRWQALACVGLILRSLK